MFARVKNVGIEPKSNMILTQLYLMDKFQLKSQYNESTTKVESQLDHMGKCP
jgi:hypothetical protein